MRWKLVAAALVAASLGCGALLGVGDYRDCEGAECTADAGLDVASDSVGPACVDDDVDAGACPSSKPACHAGRCVGVRKLAQGASDHVCAIMTDESVFCWGQNTSHQIGPGPAFVKSPTAVTLPEGIDRVVDVAVEVKQTCILAVSGVAQSVYCWGDSIAGGGSSSPTRLNVSTNVDALSLGSMSGCAKLADGTVRCWGENPYGEVGCPGSAGPCTGAGAVTRPTPSLSNPSVLPSKLNLTRIAVGLYQTCTLDNSATVACIGNAFRGNLGDGLSNGAGLCCASGSFTLTRNLTALWSSDFYSCARDHLGTYWCWGDDQNAWCAADPVKAPNCAIAGVPTPIDFGAGVLSQLSLGWRHACAIAQTSGKVYCWGNNDYNAVTPSSDAGGPFGPTEVDFGGASVSEIAAHRKLSCALMVDGRVMCWGQNEDGWLAGLGSTTPAVVKPTVVRWR